MKIEPGKFYKTRDGRKVRIYATDGCDDWPIHGATLINCGWQLCRWDSQGRAKVHTLLSITADIIGEWRDTPIVNWPAMPAWCTYVAMDKDGTWYAYIDMPNIELNGWANSDHCYFIPKEYHPIFTGNWKDSLAERNEK